jgi:hypothetical protein
MVEIVKLAGLKNSRIRHNHHTPSYPQTIITICSVSHQSSSSSLPFCMADCLCLNASASPPARLGAGLLVPLPLPLEVTLIPESLGAGGGAGFFPMGRLAGGAGGPFLPATPLVRGAPLVIGLGTTRGAAGGGGGGATCLTSSFRYAEGAQPCVAVPGFLASHQPRTCQYIILVWNAEDSPFSSFCMMIMISSFFTLSSPAVWPSKS